MYCAKSMVKRLKFPFAYIYTSSITFVKTKFLKTRCCTLRRAKNIPTRSFVSNLYISQHALPENGSQTNLEHRALHKSL